MDFSRASALGACMDENRDELIALLGTRIGMVMEDVVVVALTVGATTPDQRDRKIGTIVEAAGRIQRLADALATLTE